MHDNWRGSIHLQLNLYTPTPQMEPMFCPGIGPRNVTKGDKAIEVMQNTEKRESISGNFKIPPVRTKNISTCSRLTCFAPRIRARSTGAPHSAYISTSCSARQRTCRAKGNYSTLCRFKWIIADDVGKAGGGVGWHGSAG